MNATTVTAPAVSCASRCRQNWAMGIGVLEMVISMTGLVIYVYTYITFPQWKDVIPFPSRFINDELLLGLINSSAMICVLEFLMAILLFDGARRKIMSEIRIWLTSMLTYMILTIVVVTGLYSTGCRSQEMNAFICFTQFIRVLIILPVYAFLEDENMRNMKKCAPNNGTSPSHNSPCSGNVDPNSPPIVTVSSCADETDSDMVDIITSMY